jgi:hypothetical protein
MPVHEDDVQDFIALCALLHVTFTGTFRDTHNNSPGTRILGTVVLRSLPGEWILINVTDELRARLHRLGVEYHSPDNYGTMYL